MDKKEIDDLKTEFAGLKTQMENVEGYFNNFDITLNNHMNDYDRKLKSLSRRFAWGFWVIFALCTTAIGGLLAITALLVQRFIGD